MTSKKCCYVGFLANDRDIRGMLLVSWFLKIKYKSPYPIFVACLEDVSSEVANRLVSSGVNVITYHFREILKECGINRDKVSGLIHGGWPLEILGKGVVLSVGCDQYERCLYLDADLLVHQSLDHLLLEDWIDDGGDEDMIESGDGCGDGTGNGCGDGNGNGSREIETVPDYILGIINSHSLDTSQRDKHQIVVDKTKINSGVIRYKPSRTLALQYIKTLGVLVEEGGMIQNDQDIFNRMRRDTPEKWGWLPLDYNVYSHLGDQMKRVGLIKQEYITHFIGGPKPWQWIEGDSTLVVDTPCKIERYRQWLGEWYNYLCHANTGMCNYTLGDFAFIKDGDITLFYS